MKILPRTSVDPVRRDEPTAREYLGDADLPLTERHRLLRARSAILLRSGDRDGAKKAAREALEAFDRACMDVTALDRDLVWAVQEEIEATKT
jgi:hypothetical protein